MADKTPEEIQKEAKALADAAEQTKAYAKEMNSAGLSATKLNDIRRKSIEDQIKLNKYLQENKDVLGEQIAEYEKAYGAIGEYGEGLEQVYSQLNKVKSAQDSINSSIESFAQRAGALPGKLGWIDKFNDSQMTGADLANKLKQEFAGADGKLDKLKVTAAVTGPIFNKMYTETKAFAKAAFDMQAGLIGATGAGQDFVDQAYDVADAVNASGLSMKTAFAASEALRLEMSSATLAGVGNTTQLAATSAELSKMGVSFSTAAQNSEYLTRQMGMSADEASAALNEQAKFAMSIGVAPGKMAEDFAKAAPTIAAYGKNANKVFEDLALQSKKLGIEMSSLISITDQFDSFEQAADSAGQLNAALGGQFLDAMQMHNADHGERIQLMQQAISASGKEFDQMGKYERKMVASALGMSDMNEASLALTKTNQDLGKTLSQQIVTDDMLAERKKASIDFDERMTAAKENLMVALRPVVTVMGTFLDLLNTPIIGTITKVVFGLGSAFFVVVKAIQIATAVKSAYAMVSAFVMALKAKEGIATALDTAAKVANTGATAGQTTANGLLAGSNVAVGTSSAVAAGGLSATAGAGAAAAGPLAALGVALLKLAVAVLLIGVGIGIAAAGMALLVMAFTQLLQLVIDNIAIMPQLLLSLVALNFVFQMMGLSLIVAGVGFQFLAMSLLTFVTVGVPAILLMLKPMGILTLAVVGLALSMAFLGLSIAYIAQGFGQIAAGAIATSGAVVSMISALSGLSSDDNGFTKFVTTVESIESADIDNLGAVVDEAQRYVLVQAQLSAMGAMQSIADGITGLLNIANGTSEPEGGRQKEVVLELNNREFARAVVESLDGKLNASIM